MSIYVKVKDFSIFIYLIYRYTKNHFPNRPHYNFFQALSVRRHFPCCRRLKCHNNFIFQKITFSLMFSVLFHNLLMSTAAPYLNFALFAINFANCVSDFCRHSKDF